MRFGLLPVLVVVLSALALPLRAQERATVELAPGVLVTPSQSAAADSVGGAYAQRIAALTARGDTTSGRYVTAARRALYVDYIRDVRAILTPAQRSRFDVWFDAAYASFDARRRLMRSRAP